MLEYPGNTPPDAQRHQVPTDCKPERVFLTGGSGYVGRNVIRHFVAKGWTVIALARTQPACDTVSALGAIPFAGDLFSESLSNGMAGCRVLIHAAADTDHRSETERQRHTNCDGTQQVFEAAKHAGISRALLISTESVLLDGRPLVNATEDRPYPRRPAGGYSRTKAQAERVALATVAPNFSVIVVRPRFVWGRDDTTALPELVSAVESAKFAWIAGGHYKTSVTHIANLCEGIAAAIEKGRSGQAYFITDGPPVEFREFVSSLLRTQGFDAPDKSVPRWLVRAIGRIGNLAARLSGNRLNGPVTLQELATMSVEVTLDIEKARQELAYVPVMSTSAGLAEMERNRLSRGVTSSPNARESAIIQP